MTCAQALVSLFLLSPCSDGEIGGAPEGAGGSAPVVAALKSAARPEEDRARDADRKPQAVLSFLGIEPGMTVLEVFAGSGYYTQILDPLVGPGGKVLAHNNQAYLNYVDEAFNSRFQNGGLPHTQRLIAEANDIELPADSLDAALMILTWHDFLYGADSFSWPDIDEAAFVDMLCEAMKPGAVLGVVDHVANPGGDAVAVASKLHRIDPERIKADLANSCFTLTGDSGVLANPEDDHTTSATTGPFKGRTDRFLLRYLRD